MRVILCQSFILHVGGQGSFGFPNYREVWGSNKGDDHDFGSWPCGWLSKSWSLLGVLNIYYGTFFLGVPKKGPYIILTTTHIGYYHRTLIDPL